MCSPHQTLFALLEQMVSCKGLGVAARASNRSEGQFESLFVGGGVIRYQFRKLRRLRILVRGGPAAKDFLLVR